MQVSERSAPAWVVIPGRHTMHCSLLSPAPTGGGSAGDIPGKACPDRRPRSYSSPVLSHTPDRGDIARRVGPRSRPSPASSHTPDRGDITRGGVGEGTPSPSTKTILALLQGPRAGAGDIVVRARAGRGQEAGPYTAFLSPPPQAGAVQVISPGKAGPESWPQIPPFTGVIPCTGPWGYHPGRGRGGNPLPVDKNHAGPSPGLPRRSGGYRGDGPGRAQAWEGKPEYCSSLSPTPPALRAPPPPRGGGSAGDIPW